MTNPTEAAMREAFEAWVRKYWSKLVMVRRDRSRRAPYLNVITEKVWQAWQAAHSHARAEMEAREEALLQLAYDACLARRQTHMEDRKKWPEDDEESRCGCLSDAIEAGECAQAIKKLMRTTLAEQTV